MQPNAPINWSPEVEITGNTQIVDAFALGRYIGVQVRSEDSVEWKLTGLDIEAEMRGYF